MVNMELVSVRITSVFRCFLGARIVLKKNNELHVHNSVSPKVHAYSFHSLSSLYGN